MESFQSPKSGGLRGVFINIAAFLKKRVFAETLGCFSVPLFYSARFSHHLSFLFQLNFLQNSVMQQFKLNVVNRENTGRGVARRLRAEGNIPACIYSKGHSRSISVSTVDFRELSREIAGGAALIELTDDTGKAALTLVQDIQRHAIKDSVQHIDFFEVSRGESFVAHVPVHLNGESDAIGVKNDGGMIDHKSHEVEVRCRPSALPDFIEVDVSKLEVGQAVHIGELPVLDGVEYLGEPDQVVVSCQPPTVVVEKEETDVLEETAEVPASKVKSDEEHASESKED